MQFAPQVGDVDNNLNRADAVLSKANPQKLDLLVLPELAFSGESGFRDRSFRLSCPAMRLRRGQLSTVL
jgi:predicted amidohydrolase